MGRPQKLDGTPWPLEWKRADELTSDLIDVYTSKRAYGVAPFMVTHDAALVYEEVRRKVAERYLILAGLHALARSRVRSRRGAAAERARRCGAVVCVRSACTCRAPILLPRSGAQPGGRHLAGSAAR